MFFGLACDLVLGYTPIPMRKSVQLVIVSGFALSAVFQLAGCAGKEEAEEVTPEQEQAMEEEGGLEE